jgi:anti-sigma factor RsiW
MTCNEIREKLPLYLHDDLPAGETAQIKLHCEGCPACRKELAALRQVGQLLDSGATPRTQVNISQIYSEALQRQVRRARSWRRAALGLAGVAAMALLVFGLKLEVSVETHQLVLKWNAPPTIVDPDKKRLADSPALAQVISPSPQVTREEMQLVKDLIHAIATDVETRDQRQREALTLLVKNLEAFQYGDSQRWKATQQDVAALFTVCLGPRESNKGGKP